MNYELGITAYFILVSYILTGRDARTTRVLKYSTILKIKTRVLFAEVKSQKY